MADPHGGHGHADEGGLEKKVKETPKGPTKPLGQEISEAWKSTWGAITGLPGAVKTGFSHVYQTAKPATVLAGALALGGLEKLVSAAIYGGGFVVGRMLSNWKQGKKTTYREATNEMTIGGLLGWGLKYGFNAATKYGDMIAKAYGWGYGVASKAAASMAAYPIFMEVHEGMNRMLIGDYQPKGRKQMAEEMKKALLYTGLPVAANWSLTPLSWKIPVGAGLMATYSFLKSPVKEKKEEKMGNYMGMNPHTREYSHR